MLHLVYCKTSKTFIFPMKQASEHDYHLFICVVTSHCAECCDVIIASISNTSCRENILKSLTHPCKLSFLYRLVISLPLTFRDVGGGGVVSALDSGSRGPGSRPGQVIVFLDKTLFYHSTSKLSGFGILMKYWEVTCDVLHLQSHPEGVAMLLVASCYGNWDKCSSNGPLGSKDLTNPHP